MGYKSGDRIGLHQLEKFVGLDHYRAYYELASESVHGNSSGFYPLGLGDEDKLLIGPSNTGLTDPLHASALSITRITMNILILENDDENHIISNQLIKIAENIGCESLHIEQAINEEDKRIQKNELE